MGVHSGKFGVVNGQSSIRNWSINETRAAARAVNSATAGGTARRKGVGAWTGNFGAYGHTPVVMPGEFFTFTGYTAPDDDQSGAGQTYSGSALVDSIAITWNWAAAAIISYVVNFRGHLGLTVADGTASDATTPVLPEMCGTKVTYGASDTALNDLTQAVLTITAANQNYVNSSTACWTGAKAGPIDWTLALTQQDDERVAELATGEETTFKLWVDDTNFWNLAYGHIENYSNLSVDRESGAIIGRTVNVAMNSNKVDTGARGYIMKPGAAVAWWGTAPV